MSDLFSLDGKVILMTGGSRGLGFAMARAMAEHGAHVVLNGRHEETVAAKAEELTSTGLSASSLPFDVSDTDACIAGVKSVIDDRGHLDVLVNNAGTAEYAPFTEYPLDMWDRLIGIHLTGAFVLAREAGRHMVERGKGTIINISSIAGADVAFPTTPAYTAAKAGLVGLTRLIAVELGPQGVTCNAISPGFFHTGLGGAFTEGEPPSEEAMPFYKLATERTPVGHWADPKDIAGIGVFLASDAASFVNGAVLTIDGGLTALL